MGEEQGSRGARCCLPIVFACVFGCVDMQLWDFEAQARGVQISTISTLMPPEPTFAERAGETFLVFQSGDLGAEGRDRLDASSTYFRLSISTISSSGSVECRRRTYPNFPQNSVANIVREDRRWSLQVCGMTSLVVEKVRTSAVGNGHKPRVVLETQQRQHFILHSHLSNILHSIY